MQTNIKKVNNMGFEEGSRGFEKILSRLLHDELPLCRIIEY